MKTLSRNDYQPISQQEMGALRDRLSTLLNASVDCFEFDFNENYSHSYSLMLYTNADCVPALRNDAAYGLKFFISRVTPIFTFYGYKCVPFESINTAFAAEIDITMLPACLQNLGRVMSQELTADNYRFLEGEILWQKVEGRLTELDGKPANVFEVLFDEIG
jgi:hypothetical protein